MKLKKNLMILSIGAMTLASTATPSFAWGYDVVGSKNIDVPNGTCTLTVKCDGDDKCYSKCSCDTNVDKIEVGVRMNKGGEDSSKHATSSRRKAETDVVKLKNSDSVKGWAKIKADGKNYPSSSGITVKTGL